jgi:hypothetical protein
MPRERLAIDALNLESHPFVDQHCDDFFMP